MIYEKKILLIHVRGGCTRLCMKHREKLLLRPDHRQDAHVFYSQKKMLYMQKKKVPHNLYYLVLALTKDDSW